VANSKSERDAAVEEVAAHGWVVARETKRGYLIMRCACGAHQETLHKTPSNPNHFRSKVSRMKFMYTVEASAVLSPGRRLTDEEITDLIEAVIDDLDTATADPSVSTVRDGDDVRVTVSVTVDSSEPFAALARASEAMLAAFHAAGVVVESTIATGDLRSEVRLLQSA